MASFALQGVNYAVVMQFQNPQSWSDMIVKDCGSGKLKDAFQTRGFTDFGATMGLWGCVYGMLLQAWQH